MILKNYFSTLLAAIVLPAFMAACSEDAGPAPVSLEQSTLSYEAGPGQVILRWNIPTDADYKYVRVNYTTPVGDRMRSASIYADSIQIDNLLNAYGPIDFHLTTVSKDGAEGNTVTIQAQADAAEKTISVTGSTQLTLDSEGLWTDAQETSEGPIANLVDGSTSSYFHMNWSNSPTAFPHYIVIDLGKEVNGVSFTYTCRNNANCNNPAEMEVYASATFDKEGGFDETSANAELLASLTGLPATQAASYSSSQYVVGNAFRYLWLKILSEVNGSNYVALSEITVNELATEIEDPEQIYLDSLQ